MTDDERRELANTLRQAAVSLRHAVDLYERSQDRARPGRKQERGQLRIDGNITTDQKGVVIDGKSIPLEYLQTIIAAVTG